MANKPASRKEQNRRKFELGGLMFQAGLDSEPSNVLLGALLELSETLKSPAERDRLAALGDQHLVLRAREREPVIIEMPADLPGAITRRLRAIGLKRTSDTEWEGSVFAESLEKILGDIGAIVSEDAHETP